MIPIKRIRLYYKEEKTLDIICQSDKFNHDDILCHH
jgi:hypothetical protein